MKQYRRAPMMRPQPLPRMRKLSRMPAPRRPGRWKPVLAAAAVVLLVITLALVWGNALKKQSDAHRAELEANAWTVADETPFVSAVDVPSLRGRWLSPGGALSTITADKTNNAAILTISPDDSGCLPYRLPLADDAALTVAEGAPVLSEEVSRLHKAGLRVSGVFTVRCLNTADPAQAAHQRGLELGLLINIANAGIDDILLVGLPYGNDTVDTVTLTFLQDVKQALSYADHYPALGMTLRPDGFAIRREELDTDEDGLPVQPVPGEDASEVLYAGRLTPGRMLTICDYLVLDLRGTAPEEVEPLLNKLSYAYTRYALRLMVDRADMANQADTHRFTRLMYMA